MAQVTEESAQQRRDESEERYRALFDTLIEGFCTIEMIFDAAGKPVDYRFLEINPAFERQTGLVGAQGKTMRELAPNHEAHWFEIYGKVALTGEAVHFENEAKALGRVYDVCAYRVGGPGSKKVAILFNDISARKIAEEKALAQLSRLALLNRITRAIGERQDLPSIFQVVVRTLESELPADFACLCLFDALDAVLTVTCVGVHGAALAADLGIPEDTRIAVDPSGLGRCVRGALVYEPDIADSSFPFTGKLAQAGLRALVAAPLQVESRVFGVLVAARHAPDSFSSGECEFLLQASEHVALAAHQAETHSALQQAYEDLRQTQQAVMQQERLKALGEMASGIAHDINNAVSPVSIYTDSLLERETTLSARGREQLQIIQRAVEDVAATVARMREFYRHREPELSLVPVPINRMVREVLELTRARWSDMPQERGVVIESHTDLAPDLPAFMGVESEIREALTNLVFNAVDAMAEGGTLTVRTGSQAGGTRVHVEVCDTGSGMSEDTRARCLEPFFTTKGERGTGLGLAMVYGAVQRHGGDIEIESTPGEGSTLRLIFPAQTAVLGPDAAPTESPVALPRLRILLIDDDPLLLKSVRDALEADAHQVVTANSGQDGVNSFAAAARGERPFDAVITDLGMPYMDGRKVSEAIKSFSRTTPVILLTGWGQRLIADGDVPPHVDLILSKPPKLKQLREALAQCCLPRAAN